MANYDHWSNTSKPFKIFILPATPVLLSIPLVVLMQFSSIFFLMFLTIWIYYIIFVWIFKISPRHSWYLIRSALVGKKRTPKNENNPLQY